MLKPQANPCRELIYLNGIWTFALVTTPELPSSIGQSHLPSTLQVPVPASYNDIFVDKVIRDHVGWVLYQREVSIPRDWHKHDRNCFLRFDAATHTAKVYVDGKLAGEHVGGYTPFEVHISYLTNPGEKFLLTVAVCNELSWESIPPGRVEELANGKRKQHYQHDFFNYSGLARSVSLFACPRYFVEDITVVTDVKGADGIVKVQLKTNTDIVDRAVKVEILDEPGQIVAEGERTGGEKQELELRIKSARLWQPGNAYLYTLRIEIWDMNSIMDMYELPFGVRTVKVDKRKFLINDKPFYFTGFGKHEDSALRGKGFDPVTMIHDFNLMAWMGANSFRTAHYPYAEEVLEYADRHGIVVVNETAAVGLNLGIVAGVFGFKSPPTFSPESCNEATRNTHAQHIRELVARDKNHPSVVLWTLANEPASSEEGVREYFEPLVSLTRLLDPTRPICFTNMLHATVDTDRITDLFDVIALNRYYGWYTQTGDLEAAEKALQADLQGWAAKYNKPILMAEYGADAQAGLHAICDVPWSEEYQANFLEMFHRVFDQVESVVGEHVWSFADFQCTSTIMRVDGNKKGVFTRDRRPKSAVQVLKRRWKQGPRKVLGLE